MVSEEKIEISTNEWRKFLFQFLRIVDEYVLLIYEFEVALHDERKVFLKDIFLQESNKIWKCTKKLKGLFHSVKFEFDFSTFLSLEKKDFNCYLMELEQHANKPAIIHHLLAIKKIPNINPLKLILFNKKLQLKNSKQSYVHENTESLTNVNHLVSKLEVKAAKTQKYQV